MSFLVANWRILAPLVVFIIAGAAIGISRHQLAGCRLEVAEFRRAYDLLAQSVARQNAAVLDAEKKAEETRQRAARIRAEAAGAVDVATKSADALARVLAAPRPVVECPAAAALDTVREDLRRAQ